MGLDPDEHVTDVFVGVHVMEPTRRNYRVEHREVLRVLSTTGKERALSAERHDS